MTTRYIVVPYDKPGISLCSPGTASYRRSFTKTSSALQQDIIVHRNRDTSATRPGRKNSNKDEKLSFGLHQRIAYAPARSKKPLIQNRQARGRIPQMRCRKHTTKDKKMNGSRNTDYVLPAARMTGSATGNRIPQRVPPRPAGVQRDEPVFPPFRPGTPAGTCTHRDESVFPTFWPGTPAGTCTHRDEPVFPPFRPGTPAGTCTNRDNA